MEPKGIVYLFLPEGSSAKSDGFIQGLESKEMLERIELNPRVCNGKPIIRGTRIPVTVILDYLESGDSWDVILKEFPELSREDLAAAIAYARLAIEQTDIMEQAG